LSNCFTVRYSNAATVLVAWLWLAIVPLIVVGYYSIYLYKFEVGAPGGRTACLAVAGVCFVAVALIQTLVNVLQLTPPRWEAVAVAVGTVAQDPTILPRYLHFVLGSLAVAGIFLAVVAVERTSRTPDPFYGWLARRVSSGPWWRRHSRWPTDSGSCSPCRASC